MAGLLLKIGLSAAVLLAVAFQALKDPVFLMFGFGRHIQPLSDFPYECRRIEDSRLHACEDMWLSEASRVLYLACSDPVARAQWLPTNHDFNITGRSQTDAVVALQIDKPQGDSFEYRALRTPGYPGTAGDGLITVIGMNGVDVEGEDRVELMIVNQNPSVDPATGAPFPDQSVMGANATIEQFEVRGSEAEEMVHVHTWTDEGIVTPNRMAMVGGSKSFYLTNSHGPHKLGLKSNLSPLLGTGEVAFCSRGKGCRRVSSGHKFANGLAAHDGLIYVPESFGSSVKVFRIKEDDGLELVEDIRIDYGIDNISVDANGDVFVAAMPRGIDIYSTFKDPFNAKPSSAVLRIRRGEDGKFVWEKVLEDQGGTLPATTTAVHDAKTGRFFLSSVISPYITVCEPRS